MAEPASRKFTMADLMILIAGCAAGIAWTQAAYQGLIRHFNGFNPTLAWYIPNLVVSPSPTLASIGLALLACQLRSPRPTLRHLARRPGVLALAGAFAYLVFDAALMLAGRGLRFVIEQPPAPSNLMVHSPFALSLAYAAAGSGLAVAACWLALLATGRWKPDSTWIDRAGRLLGACWIAVHVAQVLTNAVMW